MRDVVFEASLKALADLIYVDESFVHIAMILTNLEKRNTKILHIDDCLSKDRYAARHC